MNTVLFDLLVAFVFLAMISILVAAHEYGHYLFARLFKMGVEEFAIGMGKKLKIWRRTETAIPIPSSYVHDPNARSAGLTFEGGSISKTSSRVVDTPQGRQLIEPTEFTVRMLPIGGFVRIKGMVPEEDGSEVRIPGGFYSKPPWQRLIVLFGGPLFSVLAGLVILTVVYSTFGEDVPDKRPILGQVHASENGVDLPAHKAGLQEGDVVTSVNGEPIKTFYDLVKRVNASPNIALKVGYLRDGKHLTTTLTPELGLSAVLNPDLEVVDSKVQGRIGVNPDSLHIVLSVPAAIIAAVDKPIKAVEGLIDIARKPSKFKDEAGSAVTMVAVTAEATHEGVGKIIEWMGLLSIMVGIFNLLPFPPLDGGQMLMAFAELLRGGRRLSIRVQNVVVNAGALAVLTLFAAALVFDVQRLADRSSPAPSKHSQQNRAKADGHSGDK
ncbi:MAG TPA: M50 family metallopeptidase [Fimbriimonadaceae bacterium]|nr:M50 family metallopeptidase [Fimbriimonadaceae bacterium]